ncbi:flagellin [Entomospira culicis]|uniref:Flagellin n=1 Tax=Entomospira culicis TaxID=2719989 RepID=A0A968KVK0_9SPIO|nr:flagellin [Entomospira culicis]NIZ18988.1 flagellin [Entomospira culicis]NIZ69203.1 flagellin [Entomospira culicis]WDI37789.1 flagellin [Entomospira culicis]WDI39417.1 flagellin [Entomospira culicis]
MIINHNMSAMNGARNNKLVEGDLKGNMDKLASGLRITKAGDDASGLAVSEKMRAQIRGLRQASRNAADGVSMIQTTEGYLQETTDLVHRIRELAVQSANGTYADEDRQYIQVEIAALVDEVDRVASHAQFNGMNLLTGRFAAENGGNEVTASMWLHVGANMDQRIRVNIGTMTASALGLKEFGTGTIIDALTTESANSAIGVMDNALQMVNKQRADLGAYQNRLEMTIKGLDIGAENLQASESRIRDLNMAEETVKLTTNQILSQTAVAMLAQANSSSQNVLRLLQ